MKHTLDIENLLEPVISSLGYELWGIEYLAQGKHSTLRIFIDAPGGIALHDCELVSREVSARLDVEDPISGHYCLEVSSPGIPRPLLKPAHYLRYVGATVQLKLRLPVAGKRHIHGLIVAVDDEGIIIKDDLEQLTISFSQILKGSTEFL